MRPMSVSQSEASTAGLPVGQLVGQQAGERLLTL